MISILIGTYNHGRYISDALDSVLRQGISDFEVVISDNASTDNTESICREYSKANPKFKYYRNSENLGMLANGIAAFRRSIGDFVIFLSSDDYFEDGALSRLYQKLVDNKCCGFAYGKYCILNRSGAIINIQHPGWVNSDYAGNRDELGNILANDLYMDLGATLFRRKILEDAGPYDLRLTGISENGDYISHDLDLFLRLADQGVGACFLNECCHYHRLHSEQYSGPEKYVTTGLSAYEYATSIKRILKPRNRHRIQPYFDKMTNLLLSKYSGYKSNRGGNQDDVVKQMVLAALHHMKACAENLGEFSRQITAHPQYSIILHATTSYSDMILSLSSIEKQISASYEIFLLDEMMAGWSALPGDTSRLERIAIIKSDQMRASGTICLTEFIPKGKHVMLIESGIKLCPNYLMQASSIATEYPDSVILDDRISNAENKIGGCMDQIKEIKSCGYDPHKYFIPVDQFINSIKSDEQSSLTINQIYSNVFGKMPLVKMSEVISQVYQY